MQSDRIKSVVLFAALVAFQWLAPGAHAAEGATGIIGEEGLKANRPDCQALGRALPQDCLKRPDIRLKPGLTLPAPAASGAQTLKPIPSYVPYISNLPVSKAGVVASFLGKSPKAVALSAPVRLSATKLAVPGVAYLSSYGADVNARMNALGLNGREHERIVVEYKPSGPNKPVVVTLGVRPQGGSGRTPASIMVSGGGSKQTAELGTPNMTVTAIVVSQGTDWQRIEITVPQASFAMLDYVELTPVR